MNLAAILEHYGYLAVCVPLAPLRRYRDRRRSSVPGKEPEPWDFLYYSFVVGMTAQVSGVAILTPRMRMLTLIHAVVSFCFDTVILAVVVSATVSP